MPEITEAPVEEPRPVSAHIGVRVEKVSRTFAGRGGAVEALHAMDLRARPGELVAVVGASGCGKSTLLELICGLQRPDAGEVRLAGRLLDEGNRHVPPEQRGIGIVFQDHALFPNLSVGANVAFGVKGRGRQATRARVEEMLGLVELDGHRDRYPHELSGGERQRVALARALAPEPAVLLLDEPFASLDHNLRLQVRSEVMRILRSAGTPAVFVTHDQLEALALGDRVVVMRGGRIEQEGDPTEVFHRPVNRFVARFLGDADFLPANLGDGLVTTELGSCPAPPDGAPTGDGEVAQLVRPDDVVFSPTESAAPGARGTAEVTWSEFQGASILYELRLPSGRTVRCRRDHTVRLPVGARVEARFADHTVPVLVAD